MAMHPTQNTHRRPPRWCSPIVGIVVCGGALSPFAWYLGHKTVREIDASGGRYGGRAQAQAGYILGICGTALLAFAVLFVIGYLFFAVALIGGGLAAS